MESLSSLNPANITDQLNRILLFPVFSNSMVLSGFLQFIVEETLGGNAHLIKEYTIGTSVLSKKSGYNPQADASVRIHAGRLRRALYSYYSGPGCNDPILISVAKGTYVPKFEAITTGTSHQPVSESAVLFSKPVLAVLPFNVHDEKYLSLADGLCDQICTEFTNFSELSAVSYYSAKKITNRVDDPQEAGLLLDAGYLLTGSIQSIGNTVRIRVQLVQCNTQQQIWANSYEKDITTLNTFEIQDDVVRHVVNQIAGSHGILVRSATKILPPRAVLDIKVYDAVFWYYYVLNAPTDEIHLKALKSMREAIELDPNYALGWAILGETYVAGFFRGHDSLVSNPLEEAVKCSQAALRIDLNCQHAYQSLALAYLFLHRRKDCLQTVDQWAKLNSSSASIAGGLGFCLICAGEYERGYAMLYDSIQLNSYYPWWFNAGLSFYHFYKSEFEDAIYWAEKMQGQSPRWELILKLVSYVEMERFEEAKTNAVSLETLFSDTDSELKGYVKAFLQSDELVNRMIASLHKVITVRSEVNPLSPILM